MSAADRSRSELRHDAGGGSAQLVPSTAAPDGQTALAAMLRGASSVSIAVAFVSRDGAELLRALLREHPVEFVELVARGAPITDQGALIALREAGVAVSVVMGAAAQRFHPKLWLARSKDELRVLAGSGNLTGGGLRANREQFELLRLDVPSAAAEAHEARYLALVADARSLDEVEGGAAWRTWSDQLKRRRRLADEQRRLDERLADTPAADRTRDKALLSDDLDRLYERTVEARLSRRDGQHYIPHRFRQAIDRGRERGDPVTVVASICRRQTEGFDVLLEADRPELTVEALVVDRRKPYHDLFSAGTLTRSEQRLGQFPSWPPPGGAGVSRRSAA